MKHLLLTLSFLSVSFAQVALEEIVSISDPIISIAHAGDERLFLVDQDGEILIFDGQQVLTTPFLDITGIVQFSGERGLLGLAFHPNYANNGYFFVHYSDNSGDTMVARYTVSANPNIADSGSAQTILNVSQPASNHNGGQIEFGNDGYLYIGLGDGGGANDVFCNGQKLDTLLGKILRIDVDSGLPYTIPISNPFFGMAGVQDEIWAYGMRNPWRFSFDRDTHDLYIGDVGQGTLEEVDFQMASSTGGENYGWNIKEGSNCFGCGVCSGPCDCSDPSLVDPVFDYNSGPGCATVIGGYVYRGATVSALDGEYVFADYCLNGELWAMTPGAWVRSTLALPILGGIPTFGEDSCGELYVVSLGSPNRIYRFVSTLFADYYPAWRSTVFDQCATPSVDVRRLAELVNVL